MMRGICGLVVGLLLLVGTVGTSTATTITLFSTADAEITSSKTGAVNGNNYGSLQYLTYNYGASGGPSPFPNTSSTYGLFKFDLSSIPIGSIIENATVSLYAASVAGWSPTPGAVSLYQITSDWEESEVTYNNKPTQNAVSAASLLFPNSSLGYHSTDITTLAQGWLDGTSNYGLITSSVLRKVGGGRGYVRFYSHEAEGTDFDPRLEITPTF